MMKLSYSYGVRGAIIGKNYVKLFIDTTEILRFYEIFKNSFQNKV